MLTALLQKWKRASLRVRYAKREWAGTVYHRKFQNVDEAAPPTNVGKDFTEDRSKSRLGHSMKRPKVKQNLRWIQ